MYKQLVAGRKLFQVWPREAKLNMVFAAGYLVKVLEFANRAVPMAVAFLGVWYFFMNRYYPEAPRLIAWPASVACVLFLLFLPLLGYFKLGVFALETIKEKQLAWYHLVCERFGLAPVATPTYLVLAQTVAKVLKQEQLDRSFLDEI